MPLTWQHPLCTLALTTPLPEARKLQSPPERPGWSGGRGLGPVVCTLRPVGQRLDGVMITFEEMYPEKKKRHVESFLKEGWKMLRDRLKKLERRR